MVRLDKFTFEVTPGREVTDGKRGTYVYMKEGTKYYLHITNGYNRKAEVEVFIDGKSIGTWVLRAHQTIKLERPANEAYRFNFVSKDSEAFAQGNLVAGDSNNGLIKVVCTPEIEIVNVTRSSFLNDGYDGSRGGGTFGFNFSGNTRGSTRGTKGDIFGAKEGGTVLQGRSDQTFTSVRGLNLDISKQEILIVRLVVDVNADDDDDKVRPLMPIKTMPVPPAVGEI